MSMSFNAINGAGESVFKVAETSYYDWSNTPHDSEDEPPLSPYYRPELDINLSNDNAVWVLGVLGYRVKDSFFEAAIDPFLAAVTNWLKRHLGKPSAEVPTISDGNWHACGADAGYLNRQIHRLSVLAREAKSRGAVRIIAA